MQGGRRLSGDFQPVPINPAGQRYAGGLRQNHVSFGIVEATDQTQLALRATDLVPG